MIGSIAGTAVLTTGVLALRLLFQALHLICLARLLGAHEFGGFAAVLAVAVILGSMSSLGTQYLLLQATARRAAAGGDKLNLAVPVTVIFGCLLLLVFVGITDVIFPFVRLTTGWLGLWAIGFAELVIVPLLGLATMQMLAAGRSALSQLIKIVPLGARAIIVTGLLLLQPRYAIVMYAVLYLIAAVVWLIAIQIVSSFRLPPPVDWRAPTKREARLCLSFAFMDLSATGPGEFDKAVAGRALNDHMASLYVAAARVTSAVTLPVTGMMLSILPRVMRSSEDVELSTFWAGSMAAGSAFLFSVVLAACLCVLTPLVATMFGRGYEDMGNALRVLCWALPAMSLRIVANYVFISGTRPMWRAFLECAWVVFLLSIPLMLPQLSSATEFAAVICLIEWLIAILGVTIALGWALHDEINPYERTGQ